MTTPTLTALEKLKKQRTTLDNRIQAAEARTRVSERKKDTRRKILVGAYYLEQTQNHPERMTELKTHLAGYLKRNSDRQLFDLPPLDEEKTSPLPPS